MEVVMTQSKVDSTRGKAFSNPETYKRDVPMQVWLQSRHLATLMKWIEKEGFVSMVRFRSDILKIVVEQLVIHLTESGAVKMIDTAQEAHAILEGRFGIPCNPQEKGRRNTIHNFELDDRRYERAGGYATPPEHRMQPTKQKTEAVNTGEFREVSMDKVLALRSELETQMKLDEKDEIAEELKDIMANADVTIDANGRRIITPRGIPHSVVTEDVKNQSIIEQAERDKIYALEKINKSLDRTEEKLLDELNLMKEDEDGRDIEGRDNNGEGSKGEGIDTSGDSS